MLLKRAVLDGIVAGKISLAFRRWTRSTVRGGGTLRTAIGVLAIDAVERIALSDISEGDARKSGAASRAALLSELNGREGQVYRIALRLAGADPRIALREKVLVGDEEFEALRRQLIDRHPGTSAAVLAGKLQREKLAFKTDVRKLKNLGLTESLEVGYRLSPRGRAALRRLASTRK